MTNILNSNTLEYLTQEFSSIAKNLWNKYVTVLGLAQVAT